MTEPKRKPVSIDNMSLMELSTLINDDARDYILMGFTKADFQAVVNGDVTLDEMADRVRERKKSGTDSLER